MADENYEGSVATITIAGQPMGDISGLSMSVGSTASYKMPLGSNYPVKISGTGVGQVAPNVGKTLTRWGGSFTTIFDDDTAPTVVMDACLTGAVVTMAINLGNGHTITGDVVLTSMGTAAVQGDVMRLSYSFTGMSALTTVWPIA